ncbi:MAG: hypothetical protein ABR562_01390 [Thermoplasmatota archaeon]|nr:hypothetical protein [Halobacteriales archaeon]
MSNDFTPPYPPTDQFMPVPPGRTGPTQEAVARKVMTWIGLAVLGAAVVTAFVSIMEIIGIWFDYQYVPIARAVLAILVAVVAFFVVRTLTRKPGPAA